MIRFARFIEWSMAMFTKKQIGMMVLAGVLGLGFGVDVARGQETDKIETVVVNQAEDEAVAVLTRVHGLLKKHDGKLSAKQLTEFDVAVKAVGDDERLKKDIRGEAWTVLGRVRLTRIRLVKTEAEADGVKNGGLLEVADELKKLGSKRQVLMSRFWEMQGKMAADRRDIKLVAWQRELYQPMLRLKRFYYETLMGEDDKQGTGRRMANNTGLMLLELYDRLGMSEELLGLSLMMRCDSGVSQEIRETVAKRYAHYDLVGRDVDFKVATENRGDWDLKDYRGKNVVVYFYQFEGYEKLIELQQQIDARIRGVKDRGGDVEILFVQLAGGKGKVKGGLMPGLACYQEAEGKASLSVQLGGGGSGRGVLINKRGEVMGLGSEAGMMRWLEAMGK